MRVTLYVDPACGWCQVAVDWLESVRAERAIDAVLQPYSLLLRDGTEGLAPPRLARRTASLRALRLLAATPEPERVAVWRTIVAQDGPEPFSAIDAPDGDDAVLAAMADADAVLGEGVELPAIVFDGVVGFTGPLLHAPPAVSDAVALWDACVRLASTPGFYALTRPRPGHPALPQIPMPAPPAPPVLAERALRG